MRYTCDFRVSKLLVEVEIRRHRMTQIHHQQTLKAVTATQIVVKTIQMSVMYKDIFIKGLFSKSKLQNS